MSGHPLAESTVFELSLLVPGDVAETVGDVLVDELGALSVSVEDDQAGEPGEQALFGEPGLPPPRGAWARSVLKALFDEEQQATAAATLLLAQAWCPGLHVVALQPVAPCDWVRLTQSQFEPVCITPSFWIVPSWHEPPPQAQRCIRLDPGLAFGTGTHPTTGLCLRWIAQHPGLDRQRVLDYGCGSGILAIAARMHGSADVDAVDIDPAAVAAAQENARANGVEIACSLPDGARGVYDVVLANILATPLKLLAPLLCGHLTARGQLVLSGVLERQVEELQAAYQPWVGLTVEATQDGWVLLTGQRTA